MILVTGGCGFIGSFISYYLSGKGRDVLILDKDSERCRRIPDKGVAEFKEGDLCDSEFVGSIFKEYRPQVVVHLAWEGVLSGERNNPGQVSNLVAMNNLLECCATRGCRLFIGLGAQAEYGVHNVRIDEETLPEPHTLYGLYKLAAGLMGKMYAKKAGFEYAWLRLFSTFGPEDKGNYIIPFTIKSFLRNEPPSLTPCEQRWDYLYVKDIPPLIEKVIDSDEHFCDTYNLSSGSTNVMKDIILAIRSITGSPAEPLFGAKPYRKEGLFHLEGDNKKFIDAFGWMTLTPMDRGLEETVDWFRQQEHNETT